MAVKKTTWSRAILTVGFTFLYLPVLILMLLSFNESRLVTVWAGFSIQWYSALFADPNLPSALWMSVKIAVLAASLAVVLGTMAAIVIVRMGKFTGKIIFISIILAPLVMPEVIIGLSLLLLFVTMEQSLGWPESRGMLTIWIAHVTFCTAFVSIVITARLQTMDVSIEEAARDLGAPPCKVFCSITLPIIAPALLSSWLLAFTLSLDDLVIASFVSGPGATTLPMVVFSSVRLGISPKINALATLVVLTTVLILLIIWWLMPHKGTQITKSGVN